MSRREETGLDQALARTADGAFAITPDGKIALWNRAAEKILGYSAREAVGRACCDLFVGRDESGNRLCYRGCHVMSLVKMGDPVQSFDMQTRTKGGKLRDQPPAVLAMSWLGLLLLAGGAVAGFVLWDLLFCKGQYCRRFRDQF